MLVGINSASTGGKKRIGICATTNKNFTNYFSLTSVQDCSSLIV